MTTRRDWTGLLLKAGTSAEFLQRATELLREEDPKLTYTSLARALGFSSRSYARAVVLGHKPLTPAVYVGLCAFLQLTPGEKDLLRLLIAASQDGFTGVTSDAAQAELAKHRSLDAQRAQRNVVDSQVVHSSRTMLAVFAAASCGPDGEGTGFREICRRTGLPALICRGALELLCKRDVLQRTADGRGYRPAQPQAFLDGLGGSDQFRATYLATVAAIASAAAAQREGDHNLFLNSYFVARRSRLAELKAALRQTIEQFVAKHEDADGDVLVELLVGTAPFRDD